MLPLIYSLLLLPLAFSLPDGLHRTPPMGWTSWNTYFEENSQEKMISQIDALLELNLHQFGYNILTIDDYWQLPERDNITGMMVADPGKFPNGIKYISDYMHEYGLKIGIYSSAGRYTCSGTLPGSLGHEETDVQMLLDWEIDYFKYDNCYPRLDGATNIPDTGVYIDFEKSIENYPSFWQSPSEPERYKPMADALAAVKNVRNITFELCAWGYGNVETFGSSMGHLWRTSMDISDTWQQLLWNIDINDEVRYRQEGVQGPERGWNYPDGLFVGKGGMNTAEYRTMFALWCLVKSPLMLGADLTTITPDSDAYKIITNERLIAVNQDSLGIQGQCVKDCCSHGSIGGITSPTSCFHFSHSWQVWVGPLSGDSWVVTIVNRFDKEESIGMDWHEDAKIPLGNYHIQDLWSGEMLPDIIVGGEEWEGARWYGIIQPHDNYSFKLTPVTNQ